MPRPRVLLAAVVLVAAACERADPGLPPGASSTRLTVLDGPELLQREFVRGGGHPRLVLFLSPTWSVCVDGARWVRKEILDRRPGLGIAVAAVWLPVLDGDTQASAESRIDILDDPRVRQFYDSKADVGRWFHAHAIAHDARLAPKPVFAHGIAWDAFFLYGPDAAWDGGLTLPLASGGPILREAAILEAAVNRLVDGAGRAAPK